MIDSRDWYGELVAPFNEVFGPTGDLAVFLVLGSGGDSLIAPSEDELQALAALVDQRPDDEVGQL
jgi:hypothetical protein